MINIQTLHKMRYYQNIQSEIWEKKYEQMAAQEGGEDEQGANVVEIRGSSSQPFNIEDAFRSIMTKLTSMELEQVHFREYVSKKFEDIDERQKTMFDEIQFIRTMQQSWENRFPPS